MGPFRAKGELGYEFRAEGRGAMAGVAVMWGPPRDAPEVAGIRRFKVTWGSKVLWHHRSNGGSSYTAGREILDLIAGDLWQRAPLDHEASIRRVDVCLDHWGYTWTARDQQRYACRASVRRHEENRTMPSPAAIAEAAAEHAPTHLRTFEGKFSATYYVGARGTSSVQLRVYNKTIEAAEKGKLPWMEPAWRAHGWDGQSTVWRAEIEAGGQWCQDHGLKTLADLPGIEHALWRDYFEMTRHTTGRRTRNKRCATSAVWRHLGDLVERSAAAEAPAVWEWEPRPPRDAADMPTLTAMGQGVWRKVRDEMFPNADTDAIEREAFIAYMFAAMAAGDRRALEREAKRARAGPAPPRPPPAEPKPKRVSQLVSSARYRGAELAAETTRTYVPRQKERPSWLNPPNP